MEHSCVTVYYYSETPSCIKKNTVYPDNELHQEVPFPARYRMGSNVCLDRKFVRRAMYIPIESSSGIPIFRQISNGIRFYIASGKLIGGEKVPSVRELCSELRVNPATVNKAYHELEIEGYLVTKRGLGTFVAQSPPDISIGEAEEILSEKIRSIITDATRLGISVSQLIEIIKRKTASFDKMTVGEK